VDFIINDQKVSFVVEGTGDSWNTFVSKKIGQMNLSKTGKVTLEVKPRSKAGTAVMNLHNVILNPIK